ncbi:MAG TPA: MarR family transcriptional regulator [Spirochaetia bacterium]|nr:MarR family transcriptional regulator [Spirochaetia bacterium]
MAKTIPEHATQIPWEKGGGTIGHWVKQAYIAMRRGLDASVRKAGMTTTQWQALGVLYHKPGLTHSELEKHLDIEAPSVTSLVNGMERKGWVRRDKSPDDARVKQLHLTPRGLRLLEGVRQATVPIERAIAAALSEEERETLKRLLRTVVEALKEGG